MEEHEFEMTLTLTLKGARVGLHRDAVMDDLENIAEAIKTRSMDFYGVEQADIDRSSIEVKG